MDGFEVPAEEGKRFELIDEQNAHVMRWDERWASTRIHGTTKRQVREMFEEERPALKALLAVRFEYYRIVERRVKFDGHIEVDGAYYSSPSRYIGTTVVVHAGRFFIRLIDPINHQLFREHPVTGKGMRRTVAAFNLGLSEDRTDFALWDESEAYTRRLFEFVGGVQLELAPMRPRIAALLQKHRLSFADGETSDRLSVTDRGRLERWNASVAQSLTGVGGRLGF